MPSPLSSTPVPFLLLLLLPADTLSQLLRSSEECAPESYYSPLAAADLDGTNTGTGLQATLQGLIKHTDFIP